ncbi:hypothetical protein LNKW23_44490 [Paralimibaculum aggregatum]|uniref:Uncharacterized protein n=1 Tax=Paralimibaculum aggregatum TaxID=3036245 RepID=A0ABQ6LT26_9RHOB|nr:hypothetical protein [Limibaculum sp. NKW23]GMG85232.1 hypothetical protein LNKW23_44490 [Limibaculum sp. NKW23]
MIRTALALALLAAPALAQETAAPEPEAALPAAAQGDVLPAETTIGTLHAAGYVVGPITTAPATDAAVNRFGFVMEHPDGADHPLYVCRLMVGSGQEDTVQFPLIMTNICARID